jgi:hypothetical protein
MCAMFLFFFALFFIVLYAWDAEKVCVPALACRPAVR